MRYKFIRPTYSPPFILFEDNIISVVVPSLRGIHPAPPSVVVVIVAVVFFSIPRDAPGPHHDDVVEGQTPVD